MDPLGPARLLADVRTQLQALAHSLSAEVDRITDERVGALLSSTTRILIALDEAYDTAQARLTAADARTDDQKENPTE